MAQINRVRLSVPLPDETGPAQSTIGVGRGTRTGTLLHRWQRSVATLSQHCLEETRSEAEQNPSHVQTRSSEVTRRPLPQRQCLLMTFPSLQEPKPHEGKGRTLLVRIRKSVSSFQESLDRYPVSSARRTRNTTAASMPYATDWYVRPRSARTIKRSRLVSSQRRLRCIFLLQMQHRKAQQAKTLGKDLLSLFLACSFQSQLGRVGWAQTESEGDEGQNRARLLRVQHPEAELNASWATADHNEVSDRTREALVQVATMNPLEELLAFKAEELQRSQIALAETQDELQEAGSQREHQTLSYDLHVHVLGSSIQRYAYFQLD